jgi:hypothetical protein
MQVRYSCEEGVAGFYHDLMMWAGRLAQFPDAYSFKRRLLNGLLAEYRHHLALFAGIMPKHSSITDIVQQAHHLEKTLSSLKLGHVLNHYSAQSPVTALTAADAPQRTPNSHT